MSYNHNTGEGWRPILIPRGYDVFNDYHRYLLVDGPRKTGKSLSCVHKAMRHAYEIDGATVGVVTKTLKNAKSGIWLDITNFAVPAWIAARIGCKYIKEPTMMPDTKMTYFRIRNAHGGTSEVQLHSLDHASEAEAKFKSTRFSMVYISEADQFEDRIVFDILTDQLRMVGIPYEFHQLMIDCNPPEEGDEHWLHDIFFKDLDGRKKADPEFGKLFGRLNFVLDDNVFLDPRERRELENKYAYDPHLKARFVDGLWVKDTSKGHFVDVYSPKVHIVGDCKSATEDDWTILLPSPGTYELYTGWDLGDTNHAWVCAAKRTLPSGGFAWDIIDEIVVLKSKVSIADFTEAVVERMDYWEEVLKAGGASNVRWHHWSDNSAVRYRAAADSHDEIIVRNVSKGRIVLHSVVKHSGSVKSRISLLKKMLFDKAIFFSDQLAACKKMLSELKKGKSKAEAIPTEDENKHVFDALTYMLMNESPIDAALEAAGHKVNTGSVPLVHAKL